MQSMHGVWVSMEEEQYSAWDWLLPAHCVALHRPLGDSCSASEWLGGQVSSAAILRPNGSMAPLASPSNR